MDHLYDSVNVALRIQGQLISLFGDEEKVVRGVGRAISEIISMDKEVDTISYQLRPVKKVMTRTYYFPETSTVVGKRKVNSVGQISLMKKRYGVGSRYGGESIFYFFHKGFFRFFDKSGNLIEQPEARTEQFRQQMNIKILTLKDQYEKNEPHFLINSSRKFIERLWFHNPGMFRLGGMLLSAEGNASRLIRNRGRVNFQRYKFNKSGKFIKSNGINIGLGYDEETAELKWRGGNLICLIDGEEVNAHQMNTPGMLTKVSGGDFESNYGIAIKNISLNKKTHNPRVCYLDDAYHFKRSSVMNLIKHYMPRSTALEIIVNNGEVNGSLLIREGEISRVSLPIERKNVR